MHKHMNSALRRHETSNKILLSQAPQECTRSREGRQVKIRSACTAAAVLLMFFAKKIVKNMHSPNTRAQYTQTSAKWQSCCAQAHTQKEEKHFMATERIFDITTLPLPSRDVISTQSKISGAICSAVASSRRENGESITSKQSTS